MSAIRYCYNKDRINYSILRSNLVLIGVVFSVVSKYTISNGQSPFNNVDCAYLIMAIVYGDLFLFLLDFDYKAFGVYSLMILIVG